MIRAANALAETGEAPRALTDGFAWSEIEAVTTVCPAEQTWRDAVPAIATA
jgi:hypothetical protein